MRDPLLNDKLTINKVEFLYRKLMCVYISEIFRMFELTINYNVILFELNYFKMSLFGQNKHEASQLPGRITRFMPYAIPPPELRKKMVKPLVLSIVFIAFFSLLKITLFFLDEICENLSCL